MTDPRFNSAKFLAGNRLVSSAKWWSIDFEKGSCELLMYTRNNKGPNIAPCWTPQVNCLVMEQWPYK